MTNLQIIEALCDLCDQQNKIIRRLAEALEQVDCLQESDQKLIEQSKDVYSMLLGDGEL